MRLGVMTKAERGYALAEGSAGKVAKAEPVALAPNMKVADGLPRSAIPAYAISASTSRWWQEPEIRPRSTRHVSRCGGCAPRSVCSGQ